MIAVGYSKRVSDLAVREAVPLKEQNDRIREYARAEGLKISRFYEDRGNDPRGDAGFQKMREDGMKRRFDLVVVDSLFRCGKNFGFAKNLLYETFYRLGIHFAVLEDGADTRKMTAGEVERYFRNLACRHAADFELSQRMERFSKKGEVPPNWERYGYLLSEDRTKIVVDEEAAWVIRFIFEKTCEGKRKCEIARTLNAAGTETPSAHLDRVGQKRIKVFPEWDLSMVGRILLAGVYAGDDHAALTEGAVYPPIVDAETFRKAGATFRRFGGSRYVMHLLFKRRIFDGRTGDALRYAERDEDGEPRGYYHPAGSDEPVAWFDEVAKGVLAEIENERRVAGAVLKTDAEKVSAEMKRIEESERERAWQLFAECVRAQEGNAELFGRLDRGEITRGEWEELHGRIMERQRKANEDFAQASEDVERRKEWLGKDNPWIRRFMKRDLAGGLDCRTVNELVKRIEVLPKGKVRVFLNEEGKEWIPEEWIREVSKNGKEKQEAPERAK